MSKRLSAIDQLQKLSDYEIEQLRQEIGLVQQQIKLRKNLINDYQTQVHTQRVVGTMQPTHSITISAYIDHMGNKIKSLNNEIIGLEGIETSLLDQLTIAYKTKKMQSLIRDKYLEELAVVQRTLDTKELDEINTQLTDLRSRRHKKDQANYS